MRVRLAPFSAILAILAALVLLGMFLEGFAMMVPEIAMRPGRNTVEVFEVTGRGTALRLLARN